MLDDAPGAAEEEATAPPAPAPPLPDSDDEPAVDHSMRRREMDTLAASNAGGGWEQPSPDSALQNSGGWNLPPDSAATASAGGGGWDTSAMDDVDFDDPGQGTAEPMYLAAAAAAARSGTDYDAFAASHQPQLPPTHEEPPHDEGAERSYGKDEEEGHVLGSPYYDDGRAAAAAGSNHVDGADMGSGGVVGISVSAFAGVTPSREGDQGPDQFDDEESQETDNLLSRDEPPPHSSVVVEVTSVAESRQALMHLVLWRNPVLTGVVFVALNLFCLLVILAHYTVVGLLANVVLVAIFAHVLFRLCSLAYTRFTNRRLDPYARLKETVGNSAYTRVLDLAQVEETMSEVANRPIRVDFLTPLAGAVEGALNVCLCDIKDAIMLKSFGITAKVTLTAWFVAFFCASFDAAKVVYFLCIVLFTLPKMWSMRSPAVDDAVRAATVRLKQLWHTLHDNVLSKIPSASVLKEM